MGSCQEWQNGRVAKCKMPWIARSSESVGRSNKDHQRMMVDPMFMIVHSLRSFLTAVKPTAVTPTAVA